MNDRYAAQLNRIEKAINLLVLEVTKMATTTASDLAALTAQVAANVTVEQSAITLIQGLAAQIASLANDPVAIAALASQLQTSATALGAAITANTAGHP